MRMPAAVIPQALVVATAPFPLDSAAGRVEFAMESIPTAVPAVTARRAKPTSQRRRRIRRFASAMSGSRAIAFTSVEIDNREGLRCVVRVRREPPTEGREIVDMRRHTDPHREPDRLPRADRSDGVAVQDVPDLPREPLGVRRARLAEPEDPTTVVLEHDGVREPAPRVRNERRTDDALAVHIARAGGDDPGAQRQL